MYWGLVWELGVWWRGDRLGDGGVSLQGSQHGSPVGKGQAGAINTACCAWVDLEAYGA